MNYSWHAHLDSPYAEYNSSRYVERLQQLLQQVGQDPKADCRKVVEATRKSIHSGLRSSMQLSQHKGKSVNISVTDYVSDGIFQVLEQIPEILLWIIAQNRQMHHAIPLLDELARSKEAIQAYLGFSVDSESASTTASDLRVVLASSDEKIKEILSVIAKSSSDLLGSYSPYTKRIEIYWLSIFVVSIGLAIPFDRLTYVVLTHELAHYYSHEGTDADGKSWDTGAFCSSDIHVIEGMAQFWTKELCTRQKNRLGILSSHSALESFQQLLKHQSEPYLCFQKWLLGHRRKIESVRGAMLKIRERNGGYDKFMGLLDRFGSMYAE